MKAAAPQALLPQNVAKGKKSAKTGLASGRVLEPGKAAKFRGLLGSLAAMKTAKNAGDVDPSQLTKQLLVGLKSAKTGDSSELLKTAKGGAETLKEAVAVEKHDKTEPRRKTQLVATILAQLVPTTVPVGGAKRAQGNAADAAVKDAASQAQTAVAPKAAKHSEPVVHVVDLRKKQAATATDDAGVQVKTASQPTTDRDMTSVFAQKLARAEEARPEAAPRATASPTAHAQTPIERLKEMAGSELLKASNIILRDGGGEIKLVLKPESLGSIRVRMNLVDNAIEGRIIVDNVAVKHVVEGNIDALKTALQQQGFQAATLSVSVGGQGPDDGRRGQEERPTEVRRVAAQRFERSMPAADDAAMSELLVNLFV